MRFFVCLDADGVQMQLAAGHEEVSWQEVQAMASKEKAYVISVFEKGWNPLEMEKSNSWGSNGGARECNVGFLIIWSELNLISFLKVFSSMVASLRRCRSSIGTPLRTPTSTGASAAAMAR